MKYAIIGGTGVYDAGCGKTIEVTNEYGKVSLDIVEKEGIEIAFISRHGKNHTVPPHKINYRANMKALYDLGVRHIFATVAVGSMNPNYKPGDLLVANDFLDFTKVREQTFFDGRDGNVKHLEMSDPYCKNMREKLFKTSKEIGINLAGEGVYVTTEGPRFETAAEIRFMKMIGGDMVGMTNVPEVLLAKEMGMCYSAVGFVTNWCTGMTEVVSSHDIGEAMGRSKENLTKLFIETFKRGLDQEDCNCKNSLL